MRRSNPKRGGFTLVELMIVVGIIGLLAAIGIPNLLRAGENARNGRFISDIRVATSAFGMYYAEHGRFPADTTPSMMPAGMAPYLARMRWTQDTSIGGQWDWDNGQFGIKAGVSVYQPTVPDPQMLRIDQAFDDGDLGSGSFRRRASGYINLIDP